MKILVKQAFSVEGHDFVPDMRKKAKEYNNVPFYFILVELFVMLVKAEKISILEISADDLDTRNSIPEKYQDVEPDPIIISIIDSLTDSEEDDSEDEEEDEDEDSKNSSTVDDSPLPVPASSEGTTEQSVGQSESQPEQTGIKPVDDAEAKKPSEEEIEFESLHEKAKRLNHKEKKRYEELKVKLGKK